jgi:hypothetical protein
MEQTALIALKLGGGIGWGRHPKISEEGTVALLNPIRPAQVDASEAAGSDLSVAVLPS